MDTIITPCKILVCQSYIVYIILRSHWTPTPTVTPWGRAGGADGEAETEVGTHFVVLVLGGHSSFYYNICRRSCRCAFYECFAYRKIKWTKNVYVFSDSFITLVLGNVVGLHILLSHSGLSSLIWIWR